jgi:hypothetical protein
VGKALRARGSLGHGLLDAPHRPGWELTGVSH